MATLKAQNLAKSYKGRQVVRDVSLSIESGQIVGLLGPNGAGKTTCFYMIVGLVAADQGRVLIDQQDVTFLPMHGRALAGIGYLPQEASIFRKLTVADNIMAILETRKDLDRSGRRQSLESLLQEFHITHIRDNLGMSLSGGERRRLQLTRLLMSGPNVLVLDEPTNDLDVETLSALEEALESFAGCAVVISHDRFFLDRLATHILAFEGDSHVEWFEGNFGSYEEDKIARLGDEATRPHRATYKKMTR